MIPLSFSKKADDEKNKAANKFYEINVGNREKNKRTSDKIDILSKWCRKNLRNVNGKQYQLKDLIVAKPDELKTLKNYIDAENISIGKNTKAYKLFVKYLYRNMKSSARSHLVESLGLTVCPYCNQSYVFNRNKVSFCDLDHIIPKSQYPMLAASFYNLVPVCHICNKRKNDEIFEFNPYVMMRHNEIIRFRIKALRSDIEKGDEKSFEVVVEPVKKQHKELVTRLKLQELYSNHKKIVSEMIKKKRICKESYIGKLVKEFPELFTDKKTALELIYSMTFDENEFERVPLSKFKYDIYGCI